MSELLDEVDAVLHDEPGFALSVLDLLEAVEAAPNDWLIEGLWPQASYGILGAEDKAGKTWAVLDLAVSVALGGRWLGRFPCAKGDVLALLGEGGERSFHRRIEAICEAREAKVLDLEGHVRFRFTPADITSTEFLNSLAFEMSANPPALVILDPLYLSIGDAKSSDLYGMGKALRGLQVVCQRMQAALVVTTHWNKNGQGQGANRFTGVGPGAWGRVLASVAVESSATDADGRSTVTLGWQMTGSEIPETRFKTRRRVKASDRDRLDSPMEYEIEVTDEGASAPTVGELTKTKQRVLSALVGSTEASSLTVGQIGDVLARDGRGMPLKPRTIQDALRKLRDAAMAAGETDGTGTAGRWWIP